MTRRFDGLVGCPYCRRLHTAETPFERWVRAQEQLDSRMGLVRFDLDVLIHRYLTPTDKRGTRDLQCLMGVEVKTRNGTLRPAQRDTFSMLSQVLRNRRTNVYQERRGRHAMQHNPSCKAFSHHLGREVDLRMFGMHLLVLSGDDPTDSAIIKWDKKLIDVETLIGLLRMDLDPDSLKPMDWRRRYSDFAGDKAQFSLWLPSPELSAVK